jgi:membrane fusion protein, multidrug efflux system
VLVLLVGIPYYLHARHFESTDDAFIEARVIPVSSRVGGFVTRVHVDDNMHVAAGALLVELDSRDFDARLA